MKIRDLDLNLVYRLIYDLDYENSGFGFDKNHLSNPKELHDLVGGLEHDFYFSLYWECHHPN
jgi:hypothetical protein